MWLFVAGDPVRSIGESRFKGVPPDRRHVRDDFARCLQCEADHLFGRTCLDRLSSRDRKDALWQMESRREGVFAQRAARAADLSR